MTTERYTHGHVEPVMRSHRWRTAENSAAYLLGDADDRWYLVPSSAVSVGPVEGIDLTRRYGRVEVVDPASLEGAEVAHRALEHMPRAVPERASLRGDDGDDGRGSDDACDVARAGDPALFPELLFPRVGRI